MRRLPGRPTRQSVIASMVAFAIMAFGVGAAFGGGVIWQSSDVYRFDNMADVGDATLYRDHSGLTMKIKSSVEGELTEFGALLGKDFMPGDATTNWWVVFNNPGNCSDGICGEDDVLAAFGGDPNNVKTDVLFATGHIAGSNWVASARLNEGDTSGSILPMFELPAVGLMDAMKAEIHIIVRSHGPMNNLAPGEVAEAITSLNGGCGTNTCGDAQFAVFEP